MKNQPCRQNTQETCNTRPRALKKHIPKNHKITYKRGFVGRDQMSLDGSPLFPAASTVGVLLNLRKISAETADKMCAVCPNNPQN